MEIQNSTWKSIKGWDTLLFVEPLGFWKYFIMSTLFQR